LIVFLLALGASYEAFMAAGDADRYPARGQLVESWSTAVVITFIWDHPALVVDAIRQVAQAARR
jgi:hypothetical protein